MAALCAVQQICRLTPAAEPRHDAYMRGTMLLLALGLVWSQLAGAADEANSATVIGRSASISDGVEAMLAQHWLQGIQLTEQGLPSLSSASDRAAAFSNLCAAYVALRDFDRALTYCDEALQLDNGNWRTYNNRAGALIGKGRLDEALHDVESGLALDPVAPTLRKTETIVRDELKKLYGPRRTPTNPG
jgi:tetratricopeptide (TPR) repeat protein